MVTETGLHLTNFLPIHDELMSAGYESQAIAVVERFGDILTERVTGTSVGWEKAQC